MICTSCAYLEYSIHEYTITSTGTLSLNTNQQTLKFDEYELRANNSILVCWDTPDSNRTDSPVKHKINWIQTWYISLLFIYLFIFSNFGWTRNQKSSYIVAFIPFTRLILLVVTALEGVYKVYFAINKYIIIWRLPPTQYFRIIGQKSPSNA